MERPEKVNIQLPDTIELKSLTPATQEILQEFGLEAPAKLNEYSIALEDSLIEILNKHQRSLREISRLRAILEEHNVIFSPPPEYKP